MSDQSESETPDSPFLDGNNLLFPRLDTDTINIDLVDSHHETNTDHHHNHDHDVVFEGRSENTKKFESIINFSFAPNNSHLSTDNIFKDTPLDNINIFSNKSSFNNGFDGFQDDFIDDYHNMGILFPQIAYDTTLFSQKYAGLKNQGATCYMNSLLQALFHLPAFRSLVYKINDKIDKPDEENIPLNLKLLFARMQKNCFSSISTQDLTRSFGWTSSLTFMQHDVQEFCRVLLGNLENKMRGTDYNDSIKYIFGGVYKTYTKGINVEFYNSKETDFYDLSLEVNGCENIYQSFDKYVEKEILCGDNQYNTEQYGKQDVEMGIEFVKFPRVLYLHLKRFQIDPETNSSIKINSRLEFYNKINLTKYLAPNSDIHKNSLTELLCDTKKGFEYELFGVLVHSGTTVSGHYYAFLRPTIDDDWHEFNDSTVHKVDSFQATERNFGGNNQSFSAYMLIYVNSIEKNKLYVPVDDQCIPKKILDRIHNGSESKCKGDDMVNFFIFTEESTIKQNALKGKLNFHPNEGENLSISLYKSQTLNRLYKEVASYFNVDEKLIEIWQFMTDGLIEKLNNDFSSLYQYPNIFHVFVFIKMDEENPNSLNSYFSIFDKFAPIFVFLYCPFVKPLFSFLFSKGVDPQNTIFSIIKPEVIKRIKNVSEENIVIYQKDDNLYEISSDIVTFSMSDKTNGVIKSFIYVIELKNWEGVQYPSPESHHPNLKNEYNYFDYISPDILQSYSALTFYEYSSEMTKLKINYIFQKNLKNTLNSTNNNFHNDSIHNNDNDSKYNNDLHQNTLCEFKNEIKNYWNNDTNESKEINFPRYISFSEFKGFVKTIFNITQEVLFFRKHQPLPFNFDDTDLMATCLLPSDKELDIIEVDSTLPNASLIRYRIQISLDSFKIYTTFDALFSKNSPVSQIKELILNKIMRLNINKLNEIDNLQNFRTLNIKRNKITKILDGYETINDLTYILRFEPIPVDQIESNRLIFVNFQKKSNFSPFVLNYEENITILNIKKKILNICEVPEEEIHSFRFTFFTEDKKKLMTKDELDLCDLPNFTQILVYKIEKTPVIDRSVHLYN
ncbi:hypothetical protein TRFO_18287 [Tritrichomonas foetus]|uniref:USP domain-containing protein n=1 Tax=Tritrichomonas foetus TaxID=1144522 RepID=A0A1J4KQD5_9EUKA|nr:hypothetical protein TRFO_18287 [Tritrichomonas foetus]|eukprot:OHT12004.1 hypothetical protein TRFO_18287 [Tritrichomonas foetus]